MACRVPFSTYNLLFQACFLHNENINSTQGFFSSLTNQNSSVYGKPFCRFPHYFLARLLGIWALPGTKLIFTSIYSDVLIHSHHAYSPSITQSQCINCPNFYRPPGQTPYFCRFLCGKQPVCTVANPGRSSLGLLHEVFVCNNLACQVPIRNKSCWEDTGEALLHLLSQ